MARYFDDESGELKTGYFYDIFTTVLFDEAPRRNGTIRSERPAALYDLQVSGEVVKYDTSRHCKRNPRHVWKSTPRIGADIELEGNGPQLIVDSGSNCVYVRRALRDRLNDSQLVGTDTFRCRVLSSDGEPVLEGKGPEIYGLTFPGANFSRSRKLVPPDWPNICTHCKREPVI